MRQKTGLYLTALACFQIILFCWYYYREISWNIPINSDQAVYLRNSYNLEQGIKDGGIAALPTGLKKLITTSANGFGLPTEGLILSLLKDGTRFSRMQLNLVALLAMEICAFYTISYLTSSQLWGWALLGLILSQNVAWFWAGGMFDFRPDFVAYCAYGIWVCAVVRSEVCLSRRWSIISAIAIFFLVINRYVAVVYATGVVLSLAAILLILYWRNFTNPEKAGPIRQRLVNLTFASILALALISPFMWMARKAIHDYYIVGHLLGSEKIIRMNEAGVHNFSEFLQFYPESIYKNDLQKFSFVVSAVLIGFAIFARWISHKAPNGSRTNSIIYVPAPERLRVIFLLLSIAVPIAALTADYSKSGVVGSIVCVPIAILLAYLTSFICGQFGSRIAQTIMVCGAFIVLLMGVGNIVSKTRVHTSDYRHRNDLLRLIDVAQWVAWTAKDRGWREPHVSFDIVSIYLCTGVLCCEAFEHGNPPIDYHPELGGSISSMDKRQAFNLLKNSDFVFLTTTPKKGPYPFFDSMKQLEPELDAWVQTHYTRGREFDFKGDHVTIYVRPTAQ